MTTLHQAQSEAEKPRLERSGLNRLIQIFVSIVVMGVVLFLSAGRLNWPAAWIFLGSYALVILTLGVWVMRKHPDVVNERGKLQNMKSWDKKLMTIYTVMLFVVFAVAGLDAGRFGWSVMPIAVQVAGYIALLFAMAVTYWAMAVNPFLSTIVRIQDDRGQYAVTSGPYRYVRHPMYAMILLMYPGIALLLGSWWALIPAAVIAIVFVIRTALEDQTLQAELPGYAEYAQRTRYRLVPGVW
jgi:protein-S-isoprenylcysteine O-methyltransferase Ste14